MTLCRSGHGKSTLALCLLRALQVMGGKIYLDGEDVMQSVTLKIPTQIL